MKILGKLARNLYRAASLANTANIILSGNPKRIVKHTMRKTAYKKFGRIIK